jgi:hypothetical protein
LSGAAGASGSDVVAYTAKVDLMLFYQITDRGQQALADATTEKE